MPESQPETELNHLAVIPDGNNRWAEQNQVPLFAAYRQGADRGRELIGQSHASDA